MLAKLIGLFLVILPWMIFPRPDVYDQTRMIKSAFFDFGCMAIIVYGLYSGSIQRYKNKILAILTGYVFIIQFFNWYKPQICSYNKTLLLNISTVTPMLHFILAVLATYFACSILKKDDFKVIAKCLAWSSIAVAGYVLLQKINIDPWGQIMFKPGLFAPMISYTTDHNHCTAMLDNPNIVGGYLGMCFPFILSLRKWWVYLIALCIPLILFWIESMGGLAIFLLGAGIYFALTDWKREKLTYKFAALVVISLIVAAMIYFITIFNWSSDIGELSFNGRFRILASSWEYFKQNPLWGKGLGVFQTYGIKVGALWAKEAHCDWFERMCELGIMGTGLIAILAGRSIKHFSFDRSNRTAIASLASFICFLVLMIFSFPIENGALAFTGLTLFWAVETL